VRLLLPIAAFAAAFFTLACSAITANTNTAANKPVSYQGTNTVNTAPAAEPTRLATPKIATPVSFDVDKSGEPRKGNPFGDPEKAT
jgi:hypothetical protein